MLRNVFIHMSNEQPIVADLLEMPAGTDRSIRCTNVRTVDGKRPSFVHGQDSTFVFPLSTIRLIEVPAQVAQSTDATSANTQASQGSAVDEAARDEALSKWDEEPDEDLLARIRSV